MLEIIGVKINDSLRKIRLSPYSSVFSLILKIFALFGITWGVMEFMYFILSGFMEDKGARFFSVLTGIFIVIVGGIFIIVQERFTSKDILDFDHYVKALANMKNPEDFKLKDFIDSHYISLNGRDYWSKEKLNTSLDCFCLDYWIKQKEFPCLLVIGTAGTGKSILAEYLAYQFAQRYLKSPTTERIPILVNLRKMKSGGELRGLITDLLINTWGIQFANWKNFIQMHEEGKFVLILDGFDETLKRISYVDLQENFESIMNLIKPNGKMKVWLSTRPEVFISKKELEETIPINKIQSSHININGRERLNNLKIDKPLSKTSIIGVEFSEITANQVKDYLCKRFGKNNGIVRYNIISKNVQLKDLSERAITLDMIAETIDDFEASSEITLYDLYENYTDKWLKKDIKRGTTILGKKEKLPLIIAVAWRWLKSEGKTVTHENLVNIRKNLEKTLEVDQDELNYVVGDLIKSTFLMHTMEHKRYTFNHKSFAEFFVAQDFNTETNQNISLLLKLDNASIWGVLAFFNSYSKELILSNALNAQHIQFWIYSLLTLDNLEHSHYRINQAFEYIKKQRFVPSDYETVLEPVLIYRGNKSDKKITGLVFSALHLNKCNLNTIKHLIDLEYLDLSLNNLNFVNLEPLKYLPNLKTLKLYINRLRTIDLKPLAYCNNLKHLDLSNNKLSNIPESIGNLTQLEELNLDNNALTSLPETMSKLTNLKRLDFQFNEIKNIPKCFSNLTKLEDIDLSRFPLIKVPDWLEEFKHLRILNLTKCQLKFLPDWLGNLKHLKLLYLGFNQLEFIPEALARLTDLIGLFLHDNNLKSLPQSLKQLKQLQILTLSKNQLIYLPEWIGDLIELERLVIGGNPLEEILYWIGNLDNLEELSLNNLKLSRVPIHINQLKYLKNLDLSNNHISVIPDWLRSFSKLERLNLEGNEELGSDARLWRNDELRKRFS